MPCALLYPRISLFFRLLCLHSWEFYSSLINPNEIKYLLGIICTATLCVTCRHWCGKLADCSELQHHRLFTRFTSHHPLHLRSLWNKHRLQNIHDRRCNQFIVRKELFLATEWCSIFMFSAPCPQTLFYHHRSRGHSSLLYNDKGF